MVQKIAAIKKQRIKKIKPSFPSEYVPLGFMPSAEQYYSPTRSCCQVLFFRQSDYLLQSPCKTQSDSLALQKIFQSFNCFFLKP